MSKEEEKVIENKIINLLSGLTYNEAEKILQEIRERLYNEQKIIEV